MLLMVTSSVSSAFSQTIMQRAQITRNYDIQRFQQLQSQFYQKAFSEKQRAVQMAQANNWPVKIEKMGVFSELQKVSPDGRPIYYTTFNVNASKSTRTNFLNTGGQSGLGLDGQNMTAHIWDGGLARSTHQEYDGPGGTDRFSVGDGTSTMHYHSAHVTGTIMASGVHPNAKGMAPHARAVGYDWNFDTSEASAAAVNGMLISNHSYGFAVRDPNTGKPWLPDHYFGGYIEDSRNWDELMFNAPGYLMVVAAGNDGNDDSANGAPLGGNPAYDKLSGHSTSKNNLVVANALDAAVDAQGNLTSVTINSSSSEGPTDDLRIKPDITGNGTTLFSTFEDSDTAYFSITGTSMASPNVAGTLLLLQQHASNVNGSFMQAATLKGLTLHTADDAGPAGPDAVFGWGLLNAKRAADEITNNGSHSIIEEFTLTDGQSYQKQVTSDNVHDLSVSISWTDRPGSATTVINSSTPVLVNDLDLRVTKGAVTYSPWRLTGITTSGKGDNSVDPYERVDVSDASGTYNITVSHKGSLTGGSQDYTLIVTGLTADPDTDTDPPTTPASITASDITQTSLMLNWAASSDNVGVTGYDVYQASSRIVTVPGTSFAITGLSENTSYRFSVSAKDAAGNESQPSNPIIVTTLPDISVSGCTGGISSFPYYEGFESTLGAWVQDTEDDLDWDVNTNGTPSINTGPSTASKGMFYVYVESSIPNFPKKRAILNSPCFDLSAETQASFEFKYHMYGASSMGTLTLEVSVDDGISWNSIWSKSGNQENLWQTASVDLSAYTGASLQLRFIGITGNTWQGDMAIDDISLISEGISGGDTTVRLTLHFDTYPEETSWQIINSSHHQVASGGTYGSQADSSTLNIDVDLPAGCYSLKIFDSYKDGMCCSYGSGSYNLTDTSDNRTLAEGGQFAESETTGFCVGGASE
ncbi:MAG: hypothetical protein D8M57_18915 [Candidatus Scalindua sp. AMX11]|nr:MAG: hypothetical protein DWQ00_08900 [Candidatus Scalindua sp.]NOG84076.1 S8 family serine peptidase [Planctomycetota bacterium]RZV62399.1 MAG: hypothetical protein EX341_18585 [Candidatus Scalindua sp. SCAELEC01]TDE63320.1 MAG: hypothetical protein D8M57_18915 [Candidatus Scalindua sp. AMX11]